LRPPAVTRGEIDVTQEADDVDKGGSACGVVEVAETPGVLRHCKLLDVRVAVEAHDRCVRQVGKGLADTRGPGAIDESKIRERVSAQSIDEFRRCGRKRLGKWSERTLSRWQRRESEPEHRDELAHDTTALRGAPLRERVALVQGRASIVERLVPAASSGTLSCASDRACALTPCRSTVTTSPVPARSAVSDLAPHASMSKAALSSNFV